MVYELHLDQPSGVNTWLAGWKIWDPPFSEILRPAFLASPKCEKRKKHKISENQVFCHPSRTLGGPALQNGSSENLWERILASKTTRQKSQNETRRKISETGLGWEISGNGPGGSVPRL